MDGLACLDQLRHASPRGEGGDALGVGEPRARRGCFAPRRLGLRDQDRQPGRPARDATPSARGERPHCGRGGGSPTARARKALGLTEREITILGALARGLSNDEIAKEFWVAPQTVKFHLTNIYRKLGVKNRTEATRIAYQHGLVESPIYADE